MITEQYLFNKSLSKASYVPGTVDIKVNATGPVLPKLRAGAKPLPRSPGREWPGTPMAGRAGQPGNAFLRGRQLSCDTNRVTLGWVRGGRHHSEKGWSAEREGEAG